MPARTIRGGTPKPIPHQKLLTLPYPKRSLSLLRPQSWRGLLNIRFAEIEAPARSYCVAAERAAPTEPAAEAGIQQLSKPQPVESVY